MNRSKLIKVTAGWMSAWLHRLSRRSSDVSVGILLYHRISPIVDGVREPDFNVTPEKFRAHLQGLLKRGHTFCSLQDALDRVAAGRPLPKNATIVTFDDGYENVYLHALPILEELGIPATVFLNTAYLGSPQPFPFDPWGVEFQGRVPPEAYRPLSVEQCRALLDSNLVELGAHTHTHGDFRDRPEALAADLRENLRVLRETFALDDVTFAFPYGRVTMGYAGGELTEAARSVGVRCALTTECDRNPPDGDSFSWGRCNAYEWDTLDTLQAKLAGWYSWASKMRRSPSRNKLKGDSSPSADRSERPAGAFRKLRDHVQTQLGERGIRGGIGMIDQAVVSASRFAATILLGRFCGADQLGQYGLGFTFVVLTACVQNSLVMLPYTVRSPRLTRRRREYYAGSVLMLCVGLATFASLGLWLLSMTGIGPTSGNDLSGLFQAIALFTPLVLLWEFARRLGFAGMRAGRVLALDVATSLTFVAALSALTYWERLSAASTYAAMGATCGAVTAVWLAFFPQRFRLDVRRALSELTPHWRFGGWAFASETALMSRSYIVPWLIAVWLDAAAAGVFVAYSTIVVLANPILLGIGNVLAPDLAFTFAEQGATAVRRSVLRTTAVVGGVMLMFTAVLSVVGERLITFIYGAEFGGHQASVLILTLGILAEGVGMACYSGLWSIGRPKLCFVASLVGLVATVGLTAVLTPSLGITGAMLGYSGGKLVSAVTQIVAFAGATRRKCSEAAPACTG